MRKRKKNPAKKCAALLLAAGASERMGQDKIFLPLCGIPVLARSALALEKNPLVDEIWVVAGSKRLKEAEVCLKTYGISKLSGIVPGGATRTGSALAGVRAVDKKTGYVAIHDAARPLVSQALITEVITLGERTGAAVPALPLTDTVKAVENEKIVHTLRRSELRAVQTPQVFDRNLIELALVKAQESDRIPTDDSEAVEALGFPVSWTRGEKKNLKLTTPGDIPLAEFFLKEGGDFMRVGHGYDVHRLVTGRKLMLGGVEIPYEKGLLGHSDADVLFHALSDALLGAAALGDIGHLFPSDDPRYEGADSADLLVEVADLLKQKNFRPVNADITVLAQAPKISPYIATMRQNIARILQTDISAINVKATTEEGLGFTGSGEGIAAHAVVLIDSAV